MKTSMPHQSVLYVSMANTVNGTIQTTEIQDGLLIDRNAKGEIVGVEFVGTANTATVSHRPAQDDTAPKRLSTSEEFRQLYLNDPIFHAHVCRMVQVELDRELGNNCLAEDGSAYSPPGRDTDPLTVKLGEAKTQ